MVSLVTRMRRTQPSAVRLMRFVFIVACLVTLACALYSALMPEVPGPFGDKILHGVVFYVLALLGVLAYPKTFGPWVGVGLVLFGGAIELLQGLPAFKRDPEWSDLLADAVGVFLAVLPLTVARFRDSLAALRR
jgi:hypothetical protein